MLSKKTLLLFLVLVLLAVGAAFYFVSVNKQGGTVLNSVRNLLPFGSNDISSGSIGTPSDNIPGGTEDEPIVVNTNTDAPVPVFRKIADGPVSGFTVFTRQRTEIREGKKVTITETPIRYIERKNGNVFETFSTSTRTNRLTNTTYPRIQEAFFTNTGNSLVIRSLGDTDEIKTYLADIILPETTSTSTVFDEESLGSLKGFYIKDDVSFVDISPDTKTILLATEDVSGTSIQTIDTKGGGTKNIFSSRLGEWLVQWYSADTIALTSKPSSGVNGLTMLQNIRNSTSEKPVTNVPGLTSLVNSKGDKILFSQAQNKGFALGYYDKKTGLKTQADRPTLPEKCVWSKKQTNIVYCLVPNIVNSGTYPDDWYQGTISFTDSIWKLDTTSNSISSLYDPADTDNAEIDGIRPALSPNEDYLIFMNKKDGSLWSLKLEI